MSSATKPTNITAAEARVLAEKNAETLRIQREKEKKAESAARKKADIKRHANWREKKIADIRRSIEFRIKYGDTEYTETLNSASWWDTPLYKDYLKNFDYGDELKSIMEELEKDGYKAEIITEHVGHDDSVAYMNSGGECGSEEPYTTYDTILKVTW